MKSFNLENIYKDIWVALKEGVDNSRSPFHFATLCSLKSDGAPNSRTIVIRDIDKKNYLLSFNTDIRSKKWSELKSNPTSSLLLYNNKSKTQLRISGNATLNYKNKIWEKAWNKTTANSRECYASPFAPSTPIDDPTKIDNKFKEIKNSNLDIYKENFGRIEIKIAIIDWLFLKHSGHRRAKFILLENKVNKQWLAP